MKFGKRWSNIVNGVLIDDDAPDPVYNYDPTFVEHYLSIRVDKEIDTEVLCESGVQPSARKCGGLDAGFLGCDKDGAGDTSTGLGGGIYGSGKSEGPYGDDC